MKFINSLTTVSVLLITVLLATVVSAGEIRISVCASMAQVFTDLGKRFSKFNPDVYIFTNIGPSGGLAKQIHLGAPTDLYISANPKWMDFLIKQKKIFLSSKITFAQNSLVFIGDKANKVSSMKELYTLDRIAIGSPKSVPVGLYAQQALKNSGVYDQLRTAGKLVMAKDARQALVYADRGEASGSFVYKTDALLATKAASLFEVPVELYDRISYPMALTVEGAATPEAMRFYEFITSKKESEVLKKYGFVVSN